MFLTHFIHSFHVLQWHQLDRTEQAKYYEMARRERAIHLKLYPGWSARDNYAMGKHRKKRKRQGPPQQTLPGVPGVTAHNPKPEFPDIGKLFLSVTAKIPTKPSIRCFVRNWNYVLKRIKKKSFGHESF